MHSRNHIVSLSPGLHHPSFSSPFFFFLTSWALPSFVLFGPVCVSLVLQTSFPYQPQSQLTFTPSEMATSEPTDDFLEPDLPAITS